MKKRVKKAVFLLCFIIIIIIAIISTFFIIGFFKNKKQIEQVINYYDDKKIEERLETSTNLQDDLFITFENQPVIGILKIDKLDFEGLIYDGTSLDILENGIGHFKNTPFLDGNVCLAAHNNNKFWANLHTLQIGDEIDYICLLGHKKYKVIETSQILENDWSKLENSNKNIITLITCVKGKPELRLCVQALEEK